MASRIESGRAVRTTVIGVVLIGLAFVASLARLSAGPRQDLHLAPTPTTAAAPGSMPITSDEAVGRLVRTAIETFPGCEVVFRSGPSGLALLIRPSGTPPVFPDPEPEPDPEPKMEERVLIEATKIRETLIPEVHLADVVGLLREAASIDETVRGLAILFGGREGIGPAALAVASAISDEGPLSAASPRNRRLMIADALEAMTESP